MLTTVLQIPGFFDYAGVSHENLGHIVIGDMHLREYHAVMLEAQRAGFFSYVEPDHEFVRKDWMARDGSHMLHVYTVEYKGQEYLIGWSDDTCVDFMSLSEFVKAFKDGYVNVHGNEQIAFPA